MAEKTSAPKAPVSNRMPPGVPYIVGNEAAERFCYYGINGILVVFMTQYLLNGSGQPAVMKDTDAEAWYHVFVSAVYYLPILGALLADAILGKYRTIMYLSLVYCLGCVVLAADSTRWGLAFGLGLIALGSGGIKPCVSAIVGDQFGATNRHLLPRVFTWFYFSINLGSALSTIVTPWLLEPYTRNPKIAGLLPGGLLSLFEAIPHGAGVAFGLPGAFMLVATAVFFSGRKKFAHVPPAGLNPYAREMLNKDNLKALGSLLTLVPFAAMFWALWQQNFSSWVVQSFKMDRNLFGVEWLPAQIQTVNPVFVLAMLPLSAYVVYPAIERFWKLNPLRKMGMGFFCLIVSFVIIALIQVRIDAGARPHILWQILAFIPLTAGEVLVSVPHLEFSYTQAPKKMKTLVMCLYLGSIALGNTFTAAVNFFIQNKDGTSKLQGATYFWFFAGLMLVAALLFIPVARRYRMTNQAQDQ
jgi:POT family proton-dependent oligopeptide transporter